LLHYGKNSDTLWVKPHHNSRTRCTPHCSAWSRPEVLIFLLRTVRSENREGSLRVHWYNCTPYIATTHYATGIRSTWSGRSSLSSCLVHFPSSLCNKRNKSFWKEIISRFLFNLIRHILHRKHRVQRFLYCCVWSVYLTVVLQRLSFLASIFQVLLYRNADIKTLSWTHETAFISQNKNSWQKRAPSDIRKFPSCAFQFNKLNEVRNKGKAGQGFNSSSDATRSYSGLPKNCKRLRIPQELPHNRRHIVNWVFPLRRTVFSPSRQGAAHWLRRHATSTEVAGRRSDEENDFFFNLH
jgi:hypothetical protein